jgi:hypothetical protein
MLERLIGWCNPELYLIIFLFFFVRTADLFRPTMRILLYLKKSS